MDVFKLSRTWFDFSFENPEKINPNHSAMYFFIIEHSNRLGWKEKFGLPMEMTKDAIGIKNYRTYSKTFSDLVEWGFIKVIQKSKNQYSANIIAIVENTKATTKALDKAMIKHSQKQVQEQCNSIVYIDIQETINNKQETKKHNYIFLDIEFEDCFLDWLLYKKNRKEAYKDDKSIELLYKKILKLSRGDPENAKLIVNESMANNWSGLFELNEKPKTQINGTHKQSNNTNQKPAGLGTHQSLFGS